MIRAALLPAFVCLALASSAAAAAAPARSISSSKQFIVYCTDDLLRGRVANFAEEVKADLLALLGETDRLTRRMPILISLERASSPAAAADRCSSVFFETPEGSKIEIAVQIGDDIAAVNLQKHIARAVLLEYRYRARGGIKGGEQYREAPWWLVEGAVQIFRQRDRGTDAEFFRQLIATNKLPAIQDFLALKANDVGSTAQSIDAICAMCLVQLLTRATFRQAQPLAPAPRMAGERWRLRGGAGGTFPGSERSWQPAEMVDGESGTAFGCGSFQGPLRRRNGSRPRRAPAV
jgi:hypothetical protein